MSELFTGIEHLAISAKSPEALADWYGRVFGFQIQATFENGGGKPRTFFLRTGNSSLIEIFPAERGRFSKEKTNSEPGLVHFAVTVSDFDKAMMVLAEMGARPEEDERAGTVGFRVRFYRDPEGNLFHILQRSVPLNGKMS